MMSMMNGSMLYMIFWIIVIGFFIYGAMLLVMKPFEKKESQTKEKDSSLIILRERFARGEIEEKEFKERKTILQTKE